MTDTTHLAAEAQQPSSSLPELRSSPPTVMEIIELREVVEWLDTVVAAYKSCNNTDHIWSLIGNGVNARLTTALLTRAAELLQRQVLVPVSVSERMPESKDRDADGMC